MSKLPSGPAATRAELVPEPSVNQITPRRPIVAPIYDPAISQLIGGQSLPCSRRAAMPVSPHKRDLLTGVAADGGADATGVGAAGGELWQPPAASSRAPSAARRTPDGIVYCNPARSNASPKRRLASKRSPYFRWTAVCWAAARIRRSRSGDVLLP